MDLDDLAYNDTDDNASQIARSLMGLRGGTNESDDDGADDESFTAPAVTDVNLLPAPHPFDVGVRPKFQSKNKLPAEVIAPKHKACGVKGKNKKCDHKMCNQALELANNNVEELKTALEKVVHRQQTFYDNVKEKVAEYDKHNKIQLKQGSKIVKQRNESEAKLLKKNRELEDVKQELKSLKTSKKSLERQLKQSETSCEKWKEKAEKSTNDLREFKTRKPSEEDNMDRKYREMELKHHFKVKSDIHTQDLKERHEEKKMEMKRDKFSMLTGGGGSDGKWPKSMMDEVRSNARGHLRSRSPSYDRYRSRSRRDRSRSHERSRGRSYTSHGSRSRSNSHDRYYSRRGRYDESPRRGRDYHRGSSRYEHEEHQFSSRNESEQRGLSYPETRRNNGGSTYQPQPSSHGPASQHPNNDYYPHANQWSLGDNNTQEATVMYNQYVSPVNSTHPRNMNVNCTHPRNMNVNCTHPRNMNVNSTHPRNMNDENNHPNGPQYHQGAPIKSSPKQLFSQQQNLDVLAMAADEAIGGGAHGGGAHRNQVE